MMHLAFASAVAVTVPILALAAGAEVRAVRERVRRPNEEREKAFAAHAEEHELDLENKPHTEALKYFDLPPVSRAFVLERAAAIVGAFAWLVVFVLLTIAELLDLMPHGLRKAVASKITTVGGRDLLKHMLADFENAVEHVAKEAKDAAEKSQET